MAVKASKQPDAHTIRDRADTIYFIMREGGDCPDLPDNQPLQTAAITLLLHEGFIRRDFKTHMYVLRDNDVPSRQPQKPFPAARTGGIRRRTVA